jgi:DNA-directed RNA polymerase specialized sigma24 family protein
MDSSRGDETLLLAVARRDMGAFRALYERHAGRLAIQLARRCNDRDLVADAVQDTFVAVWQRPQGFCGDGDIAAWPWGIAIEPSLEDAYLLLCGGSPAHEPAGEVAS